MRTGWRLLLPCVLVALTATAFAGQALDAVAAHVAERVASPDPLPGKERKALTKLAAKLAVADLPGATDDFAKLGKAAHAARGPLRDDATLVGLVDAALDEAGQTLADDGSDVVQTLVLLDTGRKRTALERRSAAASALRTKFLLQRAGGKSGIGVGRRAANAYATCLAKARREVGRQDHREPAWSVVFQNLPGALMGVWADDDPVQPSVYAVGADDGTRGAQFFRLGGEGWVRASVPVPGDLWWVTGVPGSGGPPTSIWACGSAGAVVRYDPQAGDIDDVSVPDVTHTLFGVWGATDDDVWVVGGGQAAGGGSEPVVRHFDGETWSAPVLPAEAATRILYKVWGTAVDDVWSCGGGGLILHFDGTAWSVVPSGTNATLLTLQGRPGGGLPIAAVGGPGVDATITERTADGDFRPVPLPGGIESLNGIAIDASGDGWAAGVYGTVMRRENGAWSEVPDVPTPGHLDHHAVSIDGTGGAWFVGGSLNGTLDRGFLVHRGTRNVAAEILPRATLRGDVAPLLSARCATIGCHLAPFANEGLDLYTPEHVRDLTVNVPSHQSPLFRVVPGRPSQSYLWHKLLGTQAGVGGGGSAMPSASGGLSPTELDRIRAWILEGALDD